MKSLFAMTLLAVVFFAAQASAAIKEYQAFLSGLGENPPNASPGTGYGHVFLDDVR